MDIKMKRILNKLYQWENKYYGEYGEPLYSEKVLSEKERVVLSERGWEPNRIESFSGHIEILEKLYSLRQNPRMSESRIMATFIAGVGGSYLRGRSALSAWNCLHTVPLHDYEERFEYGCCWICGEQDKKHIINDSEFQYLMHLGNAFAGNPKYAYLNLRYLAEQEDVFPTAEDIKIFSKLLALLLASTPNETPGKCEKRLREAKFLLAPQHLRGILHSLALVGVLPNQFILLSDTSWTNWGEITICEKKLKSTEGRSDMAMPWAGWRGSLKIDKKKQINSLENT